MVVGTLDRAQESGHGHILGLRGRVARYLPLQGVALEIPLAAAIRETVLSATAPIPAIPHGPIIICRVPVPTRRASVQAVVLEAASAVAMSAAVAVALAAVAPVEASVVEAASVEVIDNPHHVC